MKEYYTETENCIAYKKSKKRIMLIWKESGNKCELTTVCEVTQAMIDTAIKMYGQQNK